MYVLALTGGLGAGKSTAAGVLAERGAVVIDLDDVAKAMLDEVPVVRDRVIEAFGPEVLGADGRIDRAALARAAFATEEAALTLDLIVHPAALASVAGALDALALRAQPPRVVVLVIPLLVEAPLFLEIVDAVVTISAHEDLRLERAIARGMTREDAERRIAHQAGDAERRDIADYVIENDGGVEEFQRAVADFWDAEIEHRNS